MLTLDAHTLLVVGFFSYTLMGCLTLVAVAFEQRNRPLLWCAGACLFGGMAYLIGLKQGDHYWSVLSIRVSNIGLITAYGCLWTSFRVFSGKAPIWSGICAGGVLWAGLCLWPVFMASVYFRVVMFSLLAIGYAVLCCRALLPNLRKDRWSTLFLLTILGLHGVFYVVRLVPWSTSGVTWLTRPDFVPTVFENLLVIISLAYGVLIMVNNRTMHRYRGALQARRNLLGHISHDLRSPLAAMLDSARLWRAGDVRRDYPHLIERHAARQMELIDELLEFSSTELTTAECVPVPGYLYAFLEEVAETTELATEHHGNRLQRRFAADLPAVVRTDFHGLRRVLTNLLGNADKYVRQGRIDFIVERRGTGDEDAAHLHFIVDDDGPGLSVSQRKDLLQPFARGDNVGDMAGSGLGLAIVTSLLERMGSHLQIGTSPSGGSRFGFELTLPLATESELEPLLEDGGSVDVDGTGYTILVVDDEPQQREITCDLLGGYGFDAHVAADVEAALDLLQDRHVDLIVTDLFMPGAGGWQLLQAVRSRAPELPVLLYSAVPPLRPVGMDDVPGFDACLLKPANGASLLRLILAQLGHPVPAQTV